MNETKTRVVAEEKTAELKPQLDFDKSYHQTELATFNTTDEINQALTERNNLIEDDVFGTSRWELAMWSLSPVTGQIVAEFSRYIRFAK
jgi:hypothetical protein